MLITRRLEFDAGHRIPSHTSKCRHLHGHRYAIEVTLSGDIIVELGVPEQGMVMVYSGDICVLQFLESLGNHKTVVLDAPPTAENLALAAFHILDSAYQDTYANHLRLERVRLFETPNCWADAVREQLPLTRPYPIVSVL